MPFAGEDKIAQEEFAGSLEITEAQYAEALEALVSGRHVTVIEGFRIFEAVAEEYVPPELTLEDLRRIALGQRDDLLGIAALRIAPLQDAVDLDDATQEEVSLLKKWKQYRILLNRIHDQPEFPSSIEWPAEPT